MRITYDDFITCVERIVAVDAAKEKTKSQKKAALMVRDKDSMVVSFGDGNNDMYQVLDIADYVEEDVIETDENGKEILVMAKDLDIGTQAIVEVDRLREIANMFKQSGKTKTSDITIVKEIKPDKKEVVPDSLLFSCSKYIELSGDSSEDDESKNKATVGVFEQALRWVDVAQSGRSSVYQRMFISEILDQPEDTEKDVWDADEFRKLISKLSADSNRLTLISASRNVGFVYNVNHTLMMNIEDVSISNTLVLSKSVDNQICAALSKSKGDIVVSVSEENLACLIYSEDKKLALRFALSRTDSAYLANMESVVTKKFDGIQCTMYTAAMKDTVNNLIGILSSKGDCSVKSSIVIDEDGKAKMEFTGVQSSTGSQKNNLVVNIPHYRRKTDDFGSLEIKLPLQVVQKVLNNIESDFLAFDIEFTDEKRNNMLLRIAEIYSDKQSAAIAEAVEQYKVKNSISNETPVNPAEALTNEDMLELRSKALGLTGFISTKSN